MERVLIDSFSVNVKSTFRNLNSPIVLCAWLLTLCSSVHAQQPEKVYRIGYLSPRVGIESQDEAFREALRELGYIEGQKIRIEWRFAKGRRKK
jgi:hypothetical protein